MRNIAFTIFFSVLVSAPAAWSLDIECPLGSYLKEIKEGEKVKTMQCGRNTTDGFVLHGPAVELYPNGNRKIHANYLNGKKDGSYMEWNAEGDLIRKITFENGEKKKVQRFQ